MTNDIPNVRDILKQAAKQLFSYNVQQLSESNPVEEIYLDENQIMILSEKIQLLPENWQSILLLHFCYGFDMNLCESLLGIEDAIGQLLYAKDILASSMNATSIAEASLKSACGIVMQDLLIEIESNQKESPIATDKRFDKKIKKLTKKNYNPVVLNFTTVAKRVAMILLAMLIASSVTVLSVEALRTRFFNWLFSVFPTHTRVEFTDVSDFLEIYGLETMQSYTPAYIPDGFELVDTIETNSRYKLYYENDWEQCIVFEVALVAEQEHLNINTENFELIEISINGIPGYYAYDGSSHLLFWSNDYHFFKLLCDTTKSDVVEIANSTILKK